MTFLSFFVGNYRLPYVYQGMRRNISEHCLPPEFEERGHDFQLISDENVVIEAEDWKNVTTSHSSTILRVHVQILSPGMASNRRAKKKYFRHPEYEKQKYKKEAPAYSSGESVRLSKLQMRPVPPRSGVVVNEKPDNTAPKIYFEPDTLHSPSNSKGASSIKQGPKSGKVIARRAQGLEEFLPVDKPATSTNLPEKTQRLIMDFPPVFTWPVGRRQGTEATASSSSGLDTTATANSPSPGKPNKDEQTIEHVLSHVHKQLLEDENKGHAEMYGKGTTISYFEVNKIIKQRWSTSLSTLTATIEQNKDFSSLPAWEKGLQKAVGGLCRLFKFFVPLAYPCAVADKFWGAIHDLLTVRRRHAYHDPQWLLMSIFTDNTANV